MLELKNIVKDYPAGSGVVNALKGISLQFRASEFVSILGPSGCGKTTLLNLIGGLDQYTAGDLLINGRSTKDFKDRDWDAYRNHSVGFVFQSYNLIPHQSVLQNVELALTLSGVNRSERRRRAVAALERVGLGDQLRKRPSEMSGGQMQRVAIARAIVNNPDIILADEPTGALDTETSVQVMDILREIAKDRLVIMVTHNPELAERYSTRIIRMLDGKVLDDSKPLAADELVPPQTANERQRQKLPTMSLWTSFGLSLKNLFTKKGRTMLTSFAGSIGIIGIALIYAVSQGTTAYIDVVQEETLSSYPLTLEAQHVDIGTLLETFMGAAKSSEEHEKDAVYEKSMIYDLVNSLSTMETTQNDLTSFKKYIEERLADETDSSGLRQAVSGVQYSYDLDLLVYTENINGEIVHSDTTELMQKMIADYMGVSAAADSEGTSTSSGSLMSLMSSGSSTSTTALWQEMLPGNNGEMLNDLFDNQYDVIYGKWPSAYNEIVLVVDENNELNDLTLYALGLIPQEDIDAIVQAASNQTALTASHKQWSYEEVCARTYKTVLNADCYIKDESTGLYTDLRETDAGLQYLYNNALELKVTGIIRPKEDALTTVMTGSLGYTHALTEYVINHAADSAAVQAQTENSAVDVFTGLPFAPENSSLTEAEQAAAFREYIADLSEAGKAEAYVKIQSIPPSDWLNGQLDAALGSLSRADMESAMMNAMSSEMSVGTAELQAYFSSMTDEKLNDLFRQAMTEQLTEQYAAQAAAQLSQVPAAQCAQLLDAAMAGYSDAECAAFYETVPTFSESTYADNLIQLGAVDLDAPATINLYASSFEEKDEIEAAIADYNDTVDELSEIAYTDYVGIMMSSVTTIINAITYVLIAFVAVSLIVSSIMIGVITLISVQERTKEIGILRAIGASKKNVSGMFNAETVMIGAASGIIGVLITYLLCIPINLILHSLTGIQNLSAFLPPVTAVILVIISLLLTLIAGIIPSRSAARKDPVVALRSE